MKDCSALEFELSLIKNNRIRKLVKDTFLKKVPDYFLTNPASSSGKYHPLKKDGTPESLVDHTKSVTRMLLLIINHPMISEKFDDHDKDILIASALLHDSAKYGLKDKNKIQEHTVHRHPLLVSCLYPYNDHSIDEFLWFIEICSVISTHHGPWRENKYESIILPEIHSDMQYYLHMADFLASRRIIHVDQEDTDEIRNLLV